MNISDEVVESAARAFYGPAFDDVAHADIKHALDQMRASLEAAAPHIMAQAWDEGFEQAVEAAAIAISECASTEEWEEQGQNFKSAMRREARRAVEAAAPHLMAQTAGVGE